MGSFSKAVEKSKIFEVICSVENDPSARLQYLASHNLPQNHQFHEDLRTFDGEKFKGIDMVVGSVPCQAYSSIGQKQGLKQDDLVLHAVRVILESEASTYLLEQVPAFEKSMAFEMIKQILEDNGYTFQTAKLDASKYGVPQQRIRLMMYGAKIGKFSNITIGVPEEVDLRFTLDDIFKTDGVERQIGKTIRTGGVASGWGSGKNFTQYKCGDEILTLNQEQMIELMGFGKDYKWHPLIKSKAIRQRIIGNGIVLPVAEAMIKQMENYFINYYDTVQPQPYQQKEGLT